MKININELNVSNNLYKDVTNKDLKKNNKLSSNNSASNNKVSSNVASLINQKLEKQEQLEKLKKYQAEHIAELEDNLSKIQESIHNMSTDLEERNSINLEDKDTNELSSNSDVKDKDTNELSTNSDVKDKDTDELSSDLDVKDKDTNKLFDDSCDKFLDGLIESGKITVIAKDSSYVELTKLADKCKCELETYKENSSKEIEKLEKEIKEIDNKISDVKKQKENEDNGNFIDLYA